MKTSEAVLFKLLCIALGNECDYSLPLSVDWQEVIDLSFDQGVAAIAVDGLQKIYDEIADQVCNDALEDLDSLEMEDLRYEWFGNVVDVESRNSLLLQHMLEINALMTKDNYRFCVLKGQGLAQFYPIPLHRQPGDIDIWVEGGREKVLGYLRANYNIGVPVIHHVDVDLFKDISVEVHYTPNWFYHFGHNRRLQKFFESSSDEQFSNMDSRLGISNPKPRFYLVYLLSHMLKHTLYEGITLRQMMDYYVVLVCDKVSYSDRVECWRKIQDLGLSSYASAVMYVMTIVFKADKDILLCEPNIKKGKRLLKDVMRCSSQEQEKKLLSKVLRLLRFTPDYPSEVIAAPIWKVWHRFARHKY